MVKPRIYWCYYPKLRRGFWRVQPRYHSRSPSDWPLRKVAYRMVEEMNRAIAPTEYPRQCVAKNAKEPAG